MKVMNTLTLLKQMKAHQIKQGNNPRCYRSTRRYWRFRTIFCDHLWRVGRLLLKREW
jgi:hypothetical protein